MQQELDDLHQQLQDLQDQINNCCQAPEGEGEFRMSEPTLTATATERAMLMQNVPNPFGQATTLGFYLPEASGEAQIKIYGSDGQEIRVYYLAGIGYGKINLSGGSLAAGNYHYSLLINGNVVASKTMLLTK